MTKGGKVRLTFKTEVDELWIASSTTTQRVPYNSIRAIYSEPIEGHATYHIMVKRQPTILFNHSFLFSNFIPL
jgi:hypothetical protein